MINDLIEDFFKDSDFKVVELLKKGDKDNKILEIYVDRIENFTIDEITALTRGINEQFDENYRENDIAKISVSSPGADKPYKYFWQMLKHKGRPMEVTLNDGTQITGKLVELNPENETFELEVRDEKKKSVLRNLQYSFKDISEIKAKLLFK
jgi:ribosome maturation factor RimP